MRRLLFVVVAILCASQALAQYPNRPIRIIIPFGPGSSTDVITRIISGPVSAALGQPIVIDPKPGGDGAVSGTEAAKAAPDGYTLYIGSGSPLAAVPALRKQPPYDAQRDFTPITDIGRYTVFLYVNAEVPARTFAEFVSHVKANPGKLAYATGNASGIVAFAQMNALAGLDMLHVPYKSAPPAVVDLVAGRVQAMMDPPTAALSYVREGKLRALVTTLKQRSPLLPEVPTIYEAGLPKFTISNWMGLVGPAGLPREIVDRVSREFHAAMKRPEVLAGLEKQAFAVNPSTPEEFAAFIAEQIQSYGSLLRAAGVQPQ